MATQKAAAKHKRKPVGRVVSGVSAYRWVSVKAHKKKVPKKRAK